MRFIIDLLYLLAIISISPKIIYRMIRHNRYRTGWPQRLGRITRNNPNDPCIWIHAVSVGEVNATKTLITQLKTALPHYEIIISATTDTGFARAKALYKNDHLVFFFPFDLSIIMNRAFANLRPNICLLMELEVWPNMVDIAKRKAIPIVVVNGRLSDKSFPRYKLITPATKWMFDKVSLFCAQTAEYANRFKQLGASPEKVIITSSLKYDTAQITDRIEGAGALAKSLNIGPERIWVAGGTGPSEEKIVLEVFARLKQQARFADLRVAIIPRKPERFDEVAHQIKQTDFTHIRYSHLKSTQTQINDTPEIILGDTMGDLKKFYSLATVVFVGRTLAPMGGSDMMEPAAMGKCTVFGPHIFNFKQTVDALLAGDGAVLVKDAGELFHVIQKSLIDAEFARNIAENGREVIKQNQGATARTVKAIIELLGENPQKS